MLAKTVRQGLKSSLGPGKSNVIGRNVTERFHCTEFAPIVSMIQV